MDSIAASSMASRLGGLAAVAAGLLLLAAALSFQRLSAILPPTAWGRALAAPDPDVAMLIFSDVTLPRILMCWLVGAGLGLAAAVLQAVLRNPLADTTTLGVSSGAYLALAAASLFAPAWLDLGGQDGVALAGAGGAAALVFLLAGRSGLAPEHMILAGLAVSLFCGSTGAALAILNHDTLSGLFVWQSGSMVQTGWGPARHLLPRLLLCLLVAALIRRPLETLELGAAQARSFGVPVALLRGGAVATAVALGAFCVSAVGVVGFLGLAAANAARLLGARTLRQSLVWSPLLGALLLWTADELAQRIDLFRNALPTGSATAFIGAPLLLWLVARQRAADRPLAQAGIGPRGAGSPGSLFLLLGAVLAASLALALFWGPGPGGWKWASPNTDATVLLLRIPRIVASASAGAMLAVAGTLMQRMTGNPMAGPEMLGVSSGAALGVVLLFLAVPGFTPGAMSLAAIAGAAAALAAMLMLGGRSGAPPSRLLLAGMALATLFSACAAMLLAGGDPRSAILLTWLSGSTYRVTTGDAAISLGAAGLVLAVAPATVRWLAILPLGADGAQALGVPLGASRLALLAVTAVATATATLVIGPLSFVGLIAPHLARHLGLRRPLGQLAGSAAAGASLLVMADWLGRTLLFPWQMPAGLVCALIGGPIFLWLMGRRA